jgi:hypothetical protein
VFCFLLIGIFFSRVLFVYFGIIILNFSFLFIFGKSVEESCLIRKVSWKKVTEEIGFTRILKLGKNSSCKFGRGFLNGELALYKRAKRMFGLNMGFLWE